MKTITFIFNKAPYGNNSGRELLDICLMASAFDMPITAIFKDEGIYQLIDNQNPETLNLKDHSKTFKALELYGVEQVWIESESLTKAVLSSNQILNIAKEVSSETIKAQLAKSDFVLSL